MSEHWTFRLRDLLGSDGPCAFLAPHEIEALAEGRLDDGRREAFRRHSENCPSCSELLDELEQFRTIVAGKRVLASERRSFRAGDAALREKLGLTPRRRRGRSWLVLAPALAAAVVVLLLLVPTGRRPLLIAGIEAMPLVPPPSTRGVSQHETWQRTLAAWNAGDFDEAARVLERGLQDDPDQPDLLFYLGYARLRLDENRAALEALARADALQHDTPSEHTRWFLAAAQEREGHRRQACATLRSIVDIGGLRASRAKEIVDRGCADGD